MDSDPEEPMEEGPLLPHTPPSREGPGDIGGGEEDQVGPVPKYHSPHQQQISMSTYHQQAGHYTQEAVRQLKASPEYKKYTQRCLSCGSVWCDGAVGEDCAECGGHAMQRPCLICEGLCGRLWARSVDMSHHFHKAHWDGHCALGEEQRIAHVLRTLVQPDESELTDALQDLGK